MISRLGRKAQFDALPPGAPKLAGAVRIVLPPLDFDDDPVCPLPLQIAPSVLADESAADPPNSATERDADGRYGCKSRRRWLVHGPHDHN